MKKQQESKIKMSRAVAGILNGNAELVNITPGLSDALGTLENLITETGQYNEEQLNKGIELTAGKNEARTQLTTATLSICAAMAAYGTTTDSPEAKALKTKYQVKDTEIKRLRDMQLFTYASMVFADAEPLAAQLEPFATAAEVANLKTLADAYNATLPKKRTQQSISKLSTQNLQKTIDRIDDLLMNTMDVLIKPWEYKEPDFYQTYHNARQLVDAASRKAKPEEAPTV